MIALNGFWSRTREMITGRAAQPAAPEVATGLAAEFVSEERV
jgi:hypothetical protein